MGIITGLLKAYWPQLAAFIGAATVGFGIAWSIQGVRIDGAKADLRESQQEFVSYKQSIKQQQLDAAERADAARQQAADNYRRAKDELDKQIAAGDAFKRCVAAGKCGVRVETRDCGASLRVPPAERIDVSGAYAISTGARTAEESAVVGECAITTLMLNQLQTAIEGQEGYAQKEEAPKAPPVGP